MMLKPNEYENDSFYTKWSICQEPPKFHHHPLAAYLKNILRDVYQYLMVMYYLMFGCKNIELFQENLIYSLNLVVTRGKYFNFVYVLSYELQPQVGKTKAYLPKK